MTDNLKISLIWFLCLSTLCFIVYLISLNSIAYDDKVKTIYRYEITVKLPDKRSLTIIKDLTEE